MKLSDYCYVAKEHDREITEDEVKELMLKVKEEFAKMVLNKKRDD